MILRSDLKVSDRAGFTLFETLISLAILSLVLAVSATALRGPSPAIQLQQRASEVQKDAAAIRDQAIRTRKNLTMKTSGLSCDTDQPDTWFHPDGSATGADLCLSIDAVSIRLLLDPLPGRYLIKGDS